PRGPVALPPAHQTRSCPRPVGRDRDRHDRVAGHHRIRLLGGHALRCGRLHGHLPARGGRTAAAELRVAGRLRGPRVRADRRGAGSIMARRILAFAVSVPLLLGWIRLQLEKVGYIDAPFAVAALMLAIVAILTGLIVRTAMRVNRIEERRLAAEAQLRDRLHEIEAMMEVLPIGLLIATDRSARRIVGNRVAREFLRIPEADGNLSLSAPPGEAPSHFRVFQDGVELAPDDLPVQR